jgi:hypothetical protein
VVVEKTQLQRCAQLSRANRKYRCSNSGGENDYLLA